MNKELEKELEACRDRQKQHAEMYLREVEAARVEMMIAEHKHEAAKDAWLSIQAVINKIQED